MAYIAQKPCSFAGKSFRIGDTIPDGLILPEAINRLKKDGKIAESGEGFLLPSSASLEGTKLPVQVIAKEMVIELYDTELVAAVEIAQMETDDILAMLQRVNSEEQLILIAALTKSDEIYAAARDRAEALEEEKEQEIIVSHLDADQLGSMDYNELRKLAKEMGLSASGTKEELIERIAAEPVYAPAKGDTTEGDE